MKLLLVLSALIASGFTLPAIKTFSLHEDLHDFIELIPKDEIQNIIITYITQDEEVNGLFKYLQSEEFKQFILDIEAIPEYRAYLKYLQNNGIDVYDYLEKLHDLLDLPPFVPSFYNHMILRGKGVRGMIDEIEAILPLDEIKALFYKKLETSEDFRNLIEVMSSDDFKKIVTEVRANPEFRKIVADAKAHGLDIELFAKLLNKIFGWGIATHLNNF